MDVAVQSWARARLAELGMAPAVDAVRFDALPVEASHRRFHRLQVEGATSFVVMQSPPTLENNAQFVTLATVFAGHGIGVPRLLAADAPAGLYLMTDLGTRHFEDVYRDPGAETVLPGAIDTLLRLQAVRDGRIPPYTRQRFAEELAIYREWFLQALLNMAAPESLLEAFEILVEATQAQPRCCVHRDFHCRNLLLTAEGYVGVVDFQDALMGPATYDLASLLRDCYHTFPETEVARWREHYLERTPLPVERDRFARDLDLTALQRQLKAVGIFARLSLRDERDSHLQHIVPVLTRIRDLAAGYPALAPLSGHVATVLPQARRRLEAPT